MVEAVGKGGGGGPLREDKGQCGGKKREKTNDRRNEREQTTGSQRAGLNHVLGAGGKQIWSV